MSSIEPRRLSLSDGREVNLRQAALTDGDAIFSLYDRIYQGNYTLDVVNLPEQRANALTQNDHLWLIAACDDEIIGSTIFQIDHVQRNGKVFAAVTRDDFRGLDVMTETIGMGLQHLMYDNRFCDVIYATTRTVSMGPRRLLKKLGFISLGIFPNVHRLAEYETHGLHAIFHPDAWEQRRQYPKLIPETAGFYQIIQNTFDLEDPDIRLAKYQPKLRMIRGDAVKQELEKRREKGKLLVDFFPFHPPNFLFVSEDDRLAAFINYEGKDGYGTIVALHAPHEYLTEALDAVFEVAHRLGIVYMELLLDAYNPLLQRAALGAQFLPCAYFPAMEQAAEAERRDHIIFARTTLPLNFSNVRLTPRDRQFLDVYLQNTEFRNLVVKMHFPDEGGGDLVNL